MYIPNYFKNENLAEVKSFLTQNSFGILINQSRGKISGTHIALLLDTDKNGKDILIGYISKAIPTPEAPSLSINKRIFEILNTYQCKFKHYCCYY